MLTDDLSNNGNCSLREAIRAANTNVQVDTCPAGSASAADVIVLQANANYPLTRVGEDSTAVNGDLDISDDLIILGNGATIDGNGNTLFDHVFDVLADQIVDISNLTITDGRTTTDAGGIRSAGVLTLTDVTVTANRCAGNGGGIQITAGSLNLIDSVVSSNNGGIGGGIQLTAGIYRCARIDDHRQCRAWQWWWDTGRRCGIDFAARQLRQQQRNRVRWRRHFQSRKYHSDTDSGLRQSGRHTGRCQQSWRWALQSGCHELHR